VIPFVLGLQMKLPVGVEVTRGTNCAQLEDCLCAAERPPGTGLVHSVADQGTAGALDHPGRDGQAVLEGFCVMQELAVVAQVLRARVDGLAFRGAIECRVQRAVSRVAISRASP